MGKSDEFSKVGAHTPSPLPGALVALVGFYAMLLYYVDKWIDRFMVAFIVVAMDLHC